MTSATLHRDFAPPVDRTLYESPGVPAVLAGLTGTAAAGLPADTSVTPPSLALHARQTAALPADGPIPGTVPAVEYEPWRPLQHVPGPAPAHPAAPLPSDGHGPLDVALTASQAATVARSRAKLARARAYAARLGAHAAEIRAKLQAGAENNAMAAIGGAPSHGVDAEALRGEMVDLDRQHRQALGILADVEAEHVRHEADLAALTGSDGTARARLAEAHAARALAQEAVDRAKGILDRATAHAKAVSDKLAAALADEARHDADAAARLRAALADGDDLPAAAEPFSRASAALADDLRAARTTADTFRAEHAARVAEHAAAHRAVLAAVDAVLLAEAEVVARELEAADARSLALRTRLHCYTKRTAGDYVPPVPKPPRLGVGVPHEPDPEYAVAMARGPRLVAQSPVVARAMASALPPPHQGAFDAIWGAENGAWGSFASALAADPGAEPDFADAAAVPPPLPLPVRAA